MKILFLEIDTERSWAVASIGPASIAAFVRRHGLEALVVQDDLTSTQLAERFDAVVTVLVLEHIDWKVGVDTILGYGPHYLHFITQQQEPPAAELSLARELPPRFANSTRGASEAGVEGRPAELSGEERCLPGSCL